MGISTRGLRSFSGSTTVASAKSAAKGLTANRGLSRGRVPHRGGLGRSRSATIKFGLQMQLIFYVVNSSATLLFQFNSVSDIDKMEEIPHSNEDTAREHQVIKSKSYWCHTETRSFLDQLRSWKEYSDRHFTRIIDSHTRSVGKGMNDLVEVVSELQAKLSAVTQEKDKLLIDINMLRNENKHLKAAIRIVQPSPEVDVNHKLRAEPGDKIEYETTQVSAAW